MAVPGDAAQGHPVLVTAASCIFTILIYVVLSPGISALWAKLRGQRPEVNFFAVADAKALRLPVDEIPAEAEKAADPPSEAQELLEFLADTVVSGLAVSQVFKKQHMPSFFVIYAHRQGDLGREDEQVVKNLIRGLVGIHAKIRSDRSPVLEEGEVESDAVANIVTNQFCLLPRRLAINPVDKVVVFYSKMLREHYRGPAGREYVRKLVDLCPAGATGPDEMRQTIRSFVESQARTKNFHHVLTEMALLEMRAAHDKRPSTVIPFSLIAGERRGNYPTAGQSADTPLDAGVVLDDLPFISPTQHYLALPPQSAGARSRLSSHTLVLLFSVVEKIFGYEPGIVKRLRKKYEKALALLARPLHSPVVAFKATFRSEVLEELEIAVDYAGDSSMLLRRREADDGAWGFSDAPVHAPIRQHRARPPSAGAPEPASGGSDASADMGEPEVGSATGSISKPSYDSDIASPRRSSDSEGRDTDTSGEPLRVDVTAETAPASGLQEGEAFRTHPETPPVYDMSPYMDTSRPLLFPTRSFWAFLSRFFSRSEARATTVYEEPPPGDATPENEPGFAPPETEAFRTNPKTPPVHIARELLEPPTDPQRRILQFLWFEGMDYKFYRIRDIGGPLPDWVANHQSYIQWMDRDSGMLGIRGIPGCGKSTMLKRILAYLKPEDGETHLHLHFFFHGCGRELQRSRAGMYRALLYQLLSRLPSVGDNALWNALAEHAMRGKPLSLYDVRELFLRAVTSACKSCRVRLFLDGLDEAGNEEARDILRDLRVITEEVGQLAKGFSICFSCRNYLTILVDNGLEIRLDRHNGAEIAEYVRSELAALHDWMPETSVAELASEITQRSSGFFLWAALIVREIVKSANGFRLSEYGIYKATRSVPTDLVDLYKTILQRTLCSSDPFRIDLLLLVVQWISFSERPLTLEDLRYGVASDESFRTPGLNSPTESQGFAQDDLAMFRHVQRLTGELAEAVDVSDEAGGRRTVLRFIHESVAEFFREGTAGSGVFGARPNWHGESHDRLGRACGNYIRLEHGRWGELGRDELRKAPFCSYAVDNWFVHASRAEEAGIPQTYLLKEVGPGIGEGGRDLLRQWARAYGRERLRELSLDPSPTLRELAVEFKIASVVHALA